MHLPNAALALADITEELAIQFGGRLTEASIARVVRHCKRELAITGRSAEPSNIRDLAHQRLERLDNRRQQAT